MRQILQFQLPERKITPSKYANIIARHEVIIDREKCTVCGKCMEICPEYIGSARIDYEAFQKPQGLLRIIQPSFSCKGLACQRCVTVCPTHALSVTLSPQYHVLGDQRWTADIISSTWKQAETGYVPSGYEYKTGQSEGGFDKLRFDFELSDERQSDIDCLSNQNMDTSLLLNKSNDGREKITIPLPVYGGDMSFGSVSLNVMLARAQAAQAWDIFTSTGEGGYPDELIPYKDHVITQVATGHFGVNAETIKRARIIVLKYAQGAKPGLGGHLLADKNTPDVATIRDVVPGFSLFSPFPFHNVYSVEDHYRHVQLMKDINPRALISVKVSTPTDIDMVAIGSYYAGAHILQVDGGYGGTGAAPDIAKKNIAMPIEYAIPIVHNYLLEEGVRDNFTIMASGGIRTSYDVAKTIALGADGAVIGTAELIALGCKRCENCERGRGCPAGIATTDQILSHIIDPEWGSQRIINLYHSWKNQWDSILAILRYEHIADLRPNTLVKFKHGRFNHLIHLDHRR
ncbi:MAG TPA: glutamate synthase-related protein [Candidatus Thermoplasmatota archaeon]|nr:glutamate synthase-related protein [Candidatus Thermoplasmatota archaeon]